MRGFWQNSQTHFTFFLYDNPLRCSSGPSLCMGFQFCPTKSRSLGTPGSEQSDKHFTQVDEAQGSHRNNETSVILPSTTACGCLTVAVVLVGGRSGETGPGDVDASHHARLFILHLFLRLLLLVLLAAVPHAALWRILVRAVETRLVERDLELQKRATEVETLELSIFYFP